LLRSIKQVTQGLGNRFSWMSLNPRLQTQLELLKTLVQRDLAARYQGSILGNLWPVVNQLAQLFIYTYVFSLVLKVKLSLTGIPSNHFTFGLWLFAGLIPWTAFVSGLMQAAVSVVAQPNLVKKVIFPLALLPLVPILSAFIESTFGLMALIVLLVISTQTLHGTLVLLPLIWVPQLLLTAGLSYLVAGMTVFLRDIPQSLALVTNLWFYLTPIVYPIAVIPEQWRQWVFRLNPLAAIAEVYRDLILVGAVQHGLEWGITTVVSLGVFYTGIWVYRRLRPAFADVL
jgi:lipopolysaccharide transport system permease protein